MKLVLNITNVSRFSTYQCPCFIFIKESQPKWSNDPNNPSDSEIYTAAFYYTTTTAAGCAFGDFAAVDSNERFLMALTLFFCILSTV